jgi:hypothetical protein
MALSDIAETMQELRRMHQLNIELLEQLAVACSFLLQNHVKIPNESTFKSLLRKAWTLLDEIQADEVKGVQYTVSRRKVTPFRTDEDETEPAKKSFLKPNLRFAGKPENSRQICLGDYADHRTFFRHQQSGINL